MNEKDMAMGIYREVELSANTLHSATVGSVTHCTLCPNADWYHNDSEGKDSMDCKVGNPLACPLVVTVVGHLTDYLTVALQELNFD